MRTMVLLVAACLLVVSAASADKPVEDVWTDAPDREDCLTEGYDAYLDGPGGSVPDGDPDGITFGPLVTTAGHTIQDVILYVEIFQTWMGDLRVWLLYDVDCDGNAEVQGEVLCRHSLDGCPPDGCCGCSGNLVGWYGFDDTAASIEDICPTEFPVGCYGPDYDSSGLDVFDGMDTGGCFWLFVGDGAGGDATTIGGWEVYVLTEITPVEGSTWGNVKAMYR